MKQTAKSLGFSLHGLLHAWREEKNFRRFLLAQILIILFGIFIHVDVISLAIVIVLGCMFVIVELLNTAMERLADTFDDCEKKARSGHYHPGIKMTKDVAAAASLVALFVHVACTTVLFIPYVYFAFFADAYGL